MTDLRSNFPHGASTNSLSFLIFTIKESTVLLVLILKIVIFNG